MRPSPTSAWQRAATRLLRAVALRWFRVERHDTDTLAAHSASCIFLAHHVSLLDALLLHLLLPTPLVCAIDESLLARRWGLRMLYRLAGVDTLDNRAPLTVKTLIGRLRAGSHLLLFPELRPTTTGAPGKIYDGAGVIADSTGATIVPLALAGLEHSLASLVGGLLRRRWRPRVTVRALPARRLDIDPAVRGTARRVQATAAIEVIMAEAAFRSCWRPESLFTALLHAVERHGRRTLAVEDSRGTRLSYGQIVTRAFVLGGTLAARVAPGERIGLMLPSSVAAVVAMFACFARGQPLALLNFTAGARNLLTAIEIASVRTVVTARAFVEIAGLESEVAAIAARVPVLYLEDLRDEMPLTTKLAGALAGLAPCVSHRRLCPALRPDDPAVVLFTSGSEGIPKGVVLSHANLLANYAQCQPLLDISARDRVLNVLPVFHAFGLLGGVLLPLFKGTPSYQYPSPLHQHRIAELCYEIDATCLFGTNTFLRNYARAAHAYDLHRMRFVIAGAEKVTEDTRALWMERFGLRIFEGYGTTEASPVVAVNHPRAARSGTVGRLVAGVEHYIEPVDGIADGGELVIRGPNVMLGYLFHGSDGKVVRPASQRRGDGWYATGDIAAIDADGYVVLKGRSKRFAKIGGEMVSLAQVEEVAALCWPDGEHAALALGDPRKGEQVVLFTTVASTERGEFVRVARAHGYSERVVPRQIVFQPIMPLLGSGKVDYPALRELAPPQARSWFSRT